MARSFALAVLVLVACNGSVRTDDAVDPAPTIAPSATTTAPSATTTAPAATTSPLPNPSATPAPPSCAPGAFCWENPRPQGDELNSVWIESPTDGWAAGAHGALLRLGPAGWSLEPRPTALGIRGLWGTGADDVWAVADPGGDDGSVLGALLHWDGSTWASMQPGGTSYGRLAGSGPADVWALTWGDSFPTMLHWDGVSWTPAPAPDPRYIIDSLCVRGPGDVYGTAADETTSSWDTLIMHWDGHDWSPAYVLTEPGQRFAEGLACGPHMKLWAPVYDFDAQQYSVVRGDGDAWDEVALPAALANGWADVEGLHVAHDGALLVIDSSAQAIYRCVGDDWSVMAKPPAAARLGDVDFAPGGSTGWLATTTGDLVPWSGTAWDDSALVARDAVIGLVGAPGGPPTMALGANGAIGRRSTAGWSFDAPATAAKQAFGPTWSVGPDEAWMAAGGVVTHVQGPAQTSFTLGPAPIVAFAGTAASDGWALDQAGVVSHWDGATWSAAAPSFPTTVDANGPGTLHPAGLAAFDGGDLWVIANTTSEVGDTAAIAHWGGEQWSAAWLGPTYGSQAMAIAGTSATDLWVSGSRLWHRGADATWSIVPQVTASYAAALGADAHGVYLLSGPASPQRVSRWDVDTATLTAWTIPVSQAVEIHTFWVGAATPGAAATIWVAGENGAVLSLSP